MSVDERKQANPARIYRSVSWRKENLESAAARVFEHPLEYKDLLCKELATPPVVRQEVSAASQLIYSRKATRSYVVSLGDSLIVKLYGLRHGKGRLGGSGDLENAQIEARYLQVMEQLMLEGMSDGFVLLLGSITMTRRQILRCGYIQPDAMFEEPERFRGRGRARYSVLFAEAADCSLPGFIHSITKNPAYSRPLFDYMVRAMLLQQCYALAAVHRLLPTFQHNDLHCSNWLVQRIDVAELRQTLGLEQKDKLVVEYGFDDHVFHVDLDLAPFRMLIWDMDNAGIGGGERQLFALDRAAPRRKEFGHLVLLSKCGGNQYSDLHNTVDTLKWVLRREGNNALAQLREKTRAFLDFVVPPDLECVELDTDKSEGDRELYEQRVRRVFAEVQQLCAADLLTDSEIFDTMRASAEDLQRVTPVYRLDTFGVRDVDPVALFSKTPTKIPAF